MADFESSGYKDGVYHSLQPPFPMPDETYLDWATFVFGGDWGSDRVVLVDAHSGQSLTFGELKRRVYSVAAGLAQVGVKQGDTVLLAAPNSIHYPVFLFGIISLGAIVTTANTTNTVMEFERQVKDSNSRFAVTVPELVGKLSQLKLPLILIDGSERKAVTNAHPIAYMSHLLKTDPIKAPKVKIKQTDAAVLMYSSGTTGLSKGVLLSHSSFISSALQRQSASTADANEQAVLCGVVPFFHIMGLTVVLGYQIWSRNKVIVFARYDLTELLKCIEHYKITILPVVPPILIALTKSPLVNDYDVSSIKVIVFGAAPAGKELVVECAERFKGVYLIQGYGLTESTGTATVVDLVDSEYSYVNGSCGKLCGRIQAKIVDLDSGRPLPPNQRGEIWLRGPNIMTEYLNNAKATADTLDKEGWLHTGDLGYFDERGFLYIADRIKELIKYNAYQIAPAELESILLSHPHVLDAAVVPFPDELAGEIPLAFIVRRPNHALNEDTALKFVAERVAPFKKIRRVIFVDSIPKSAAGKTLRRELITMLRPTSKL